MTDYAAFVGKNLSKPFILVKVHSSNGKQAEYLKNWLFNIGKKLKQKLNL